jgi:hypothetical protein
MPLRATVEEQSTGLDITQHGEEAYLHTGGIDAVMTPTSASSPVMTTAPATR